MGLIEEDAGARGAEAEAEAEAGAALPPCHNSGGGASSPHAFWQSGCKAPSIPIDCELMDFETPSMHVTC